MIDEISIEIHAMCIPNPLPQHTIFRDQDVYRQDHFLYLLHI